MSFLLDTMEFKKKSQQSLENQFILLPQPPSQNQGSVSDTLPNIQAPALPSKKKFNRRQGKVYTTKGKGLLLDDKEALY
ncbi:MAG: hypothetical protein Unbinned6242contig1001_8 [Prokaryotic dsDNA virus sp.]|nr:MAG: hypothetical protein Unbinned6242contig1001_8 [Prokaryotic dsDNA virus sp.]|tara:strand:+ start:15399 stop:15635 length:237 start_codon:yes stop_codon:yes gene_type:complete